MMAEMGAPCKYRAEYCEQVIELGRQGYSHAMIAAELDVARQTLRNWAEEFPDFLAAITHARDLAQAWFERKGMAGLETPGFNASLWAKQVSCRFPEDYTEKTKQEITGANGGPVKVTEIRLIAGDES